VLLEVSVEPNPTVAESRVWVAKLSSVAFEPGEVTLQVSRTETGITGSSCSATCCTPA
jgi:hypothetical protein